MITHPLGASPPVDPPDGTHPPGASPPVDPPDGTYKRLTEVVVAVGADRAPADPELRALGDLLAHVLTAPGDRRHPLVVGQPHEDPLDVLVDRRHQQGQRLDARLLGENAGSPESEASALCSWAVTRPSEASELMNVAGSVRIWSSASSQPPVASGRNRCATPSVAASERPSNSYHPRSGAMFENSCAVRKRSTSSRG